MVKCNICNKEFKSLLSLCRHLQVHNIKTKEYYDNYIKTDTDGICICCGKQTPFINFTTGYQKTCSNECAVKSGYRGKMISETISKNSTKYVSDEPIHIDADTDLSLYKSAQKVTFNCIICDALCSSCVQTIRSSNFNKNFTCQRCKKLQHAGKLYLPNRRILVSENDDLSKYIVKQPVQYYCTNCNKLQNTSILYLRQTRNTEKFLCQWCTFEKTIKDNYDITISEFQLKLCKTYYSKESYNLFKQINSDNNVYYGENEYGIYDKENKCYYKYDFTDLNKKKIIEFNGDYWHPKSADDPDFKPFTRQTAQEVWTKDRNKEQCAIDNGFKVFYIWEHEVISDFDATLNRCINFLEE